MTTDLRERTPTRRRLAGAPPFRLLLSDGSTVALRAHAFDVRGERAAIFAHDASGRTVGSAEYARIYGPRAELTLMVDERLWPVELPAVMLAILCRRAADEGITTLLARVHEGEPRLPALLREHFDARESPAGDAVDLAIATASGSTSARSERVDPAATPM
jgi:hypothetical protein